MVTVLRTPGDQTLVRPATCTWSLAYEEPDCAFREGRVGRHRDRVRPDCCGHLARDHRGRQRPRHQPEHEVHLDQHFAEVSYRQPASKAPEDPGPLLFAAFVEVALRMRKPEAAVAAARNLPVWGPLENPAKLVCLALLLA